MRICRLLNRLAQIALADRERAFGLTRGCVITMCVFYVLWLTLAVPMTWGGIRVLRQKRTAKELLLYLPGTIAGLALIASITLLGFERVGADALPFLLGFALTTVLASAVTLFNTYVLTRGSEP